MHHLPPPCREEGGYELEIGLVGIRTVVTREAVRPWNMVDRHVGGSREIQRQYQYEQDLLEHSAGPPGPNGSLVSERRWYYILDEKGTARPKCSEIRTNEVSHRTVVVAGRSRVIIAASGSLSVDVPRRRVNSEGGAASDLWRHTLSQIPSTFGRLVYLSSLRDQNTGRYEHHGLAQLFGDAETDHALRESHLNTFSDWLRSNLEEQKSDLDLYLSSFQSDRRTILGTWIRLAPYRNLIPADAREPERRLYLADLETLLEVLKAENDVHEPESDA